jgi:hypothetical protein
MMMNILEMGITLIPSVRCRMYFSMKHEGIRYVDVSRPNRLHQFNRYLTRELDHTGRFAQFWLLKFMSDRGVDGDEVSIRPMYGCVHRMQVYINNMPVSLRRLGIQGRDLHI